MTTVVEAYPLTHTAPSRECLLCQLVETAWAMKFINWEVVGEGVIRGQCFDRDIYRYVLIRPGRPWLHLDVTAEFLERAEGGHEAALRKLVTT